MPRKCFWLLRGAGHARHAECKEDSCQPEDLRLNRSTHGRHERPQIFILLDVHARLHKITLRVKYKLGTKFLREGAASGAAQFSGGVNGQRRRAGSTRRRTGAWACGTESAPSAMAVFINTPSAPSSMSTAASDAVPTPASFSHLTPF